MIGVPVLLGCPQPSPCTPACKGRQAAIDAGTFFWNAGLGAWVDSTIPPREKRFELGPDRIPFKLEAPFGLTDCPWCGGEMENPSA